MTQNDNMNMQNTEMPASYNQYNEYLVAHNGKAELSDRGKRIVMNNIYQFKQRQNDRFKDKINIYFEKKRVQILT